MDKPKGHEAHEAHEGEKWRLAYVGFAIAAAAGAFILLVCACFFTNRRRHPRGGNRSRQPYAGDEIELSQLASFAPSFGQPALPRAEVKLVTCEAIFVVQPGDEEAVSLCRARSTEDGPQKCVLGIKVIPGSETVANASTREDSPTPVAAVNMLSAETIISITTEPRPARR